MIKINSKTNKKLVQNFPQDPYSDIVIITKTQKLHLVLAYLAIDSGYFDRKVDPDTKQVNLAHLIEEPLMRILRSLYGGQLESTSVKDLTELYEVIQFLEIDDYRENIIEQIKLHSVYLDSLQMLEFSFQFDILVQNFKTHHFYKQLKLFQDNRNYLQLNKVSPSTINTLLIEYAQALGDKSHQTINNILENYLNRNSKSIVEYFTEDLEVLRKIWEKFHHTINYVEKLKTSDRIKASTMFGSELGKNSDIMRQRNNRTIFLQQQLEQKNRIIAKLREENLELKQLLNTERCRTLNHSQNILSSNSTTSDSRSTTARTSAPPQTGEDKNDLIPLKNTKYQHRNDSNLIDKSGEFGVHSLEVAFDNPKKMIPQTKEAHTFNRLNSRSKRIFP